MADLPDHQERSAWLSRLVDFEQSAVSPLLLVDEIMASITVARRRAATSEVARDEVRARLAQAEAEREQLRDERAVLWPKAQVLPAVQANADHFQARAERAEAALARVSRLCDAAIDRRKRLSSADGYNEISLRGAADLATNVLAALVVADTGEGLSKTSAKLLVAADTPEQEQR